MSALARLDNELRLGRIIDKLSKLRPGPGDSMRIAIEDTMPIRVALSVADIKAWTIRDSGETVERATDGKTIPVWRVDFL
jgi:hypothetical protein